MIIKFSQLLNIILFGILILNSSQTFSDQQAKKIAQYTNKFECKGNSPFFSIKYGQKYVSKVTGQLFCNNEAERTCCNQENFESLKTSWFMYNHNHNNISSSCQIQFTELVCMDCDGDIGIQTRKGICPNLCENLFNSCKEDLFKIEETTQRIKFCNKNDVLCSQLKYIENDAVQFCENMGFSVNANIDYQSWSDDLLIKKNQTELQPVCWDGKSSSKYFGAMSVATNSTSSSTSSGKKKGKKLRRWKLQDYLLYTSIGLLSLGIVGIIFYMIRLKRQESKFKSLYGNPNNEAFKGKATKLN